VLAAARPGFLGRGSLSEFLVLLAALNLACGALYIVPDRSLSLWVVTFINMVAVYALLSAFDRGVACGIVSSGGGGGGESGFGGGSRDGAAAGASDEEDEDWLGLPRDLIKPGQTIPMFVPRKRQSGSGGSNPGGSEGSPGAAGANGGGDGEGDGDDDMSDVSSDGGASDGGAGSGDELGGGNGGQSPPFPSFSAGDKQSFKLRTVGYKKHQRKAPSAAPLYDLVAMDVFKTPARLDEVYKHVDLDAFDLPDTSHPDVPALLVMNLQFPREKQEIFAKGDGPGASVVMYFKITDATLASVKTPSSRSPALNLFIEWCRLAPDDPVFRGRFKAMGFINNIKEYGIPAIAANYNGKPVLIKTTGSLYRGGKFIEMDINIHKFSYLCRTTLINMKDRFSQMVIRCGFTIEGRDDDELPEVLLGCANLNGVNLDAAIDLESM
jgi:hypothetical protein